MIIRFTMVKINKRKRYRINLCWKTLKFSYLNLNVFEAIQENLEVILLNSL
jgi:hypothetical protein